MTKERRVTQKVILKMITIVLVAASICHGQSPNQYGCRISSKLQLLWDHPIGASDTARSNARSSLQNFGILSIQKTEKTGRGRKATIKATALINAGYADGLQVGYKGAVYVLNSDGTQSKVAGAEVLEVNAFESTCRLAIKRNKTVTKYQTISFDLPLMPYADCLSKGFELFDKQDYEGALTYLRRIEHLADSNQLVSNQLATSRQKYLDKYSSLPPVDVAELRQKTLDHIMLAESFVRLGNRDAAIKYLIMAAVADSLAESLGKLVQAIKVLETCESLRRYIRETGQTVSLDREPSMTEYKIPTSPTEENLKTSEYFTSMTTWYVAGAVTVKAHIGPAGELLEVDLARRNTHEPLNQAALEAAYHSRFQPAIRCGRPVSCWVAWCYEFFIE